MIESLKARVNWVDMARGMAILAVVFGHSTSPFSGFIFTWHMPLFFFLSGFFIKPKENTWNFLFKNFKKLISLFLIFALLGFLATYLKNILLSRENLEIWQSLVGIFFWMNMDHLNHYGLVLWFLPALFWGKSLVFLLLKKINSKLLVGIILSVLFFLILRLDKLLPFGLDVGVMSGMWIFLGYVFFNFVKEYFFRYKIIIALGLLVLAVVLPIPVLNLATKSFSNPVYNVFYSLSFVLLIILFMQKISNYVKTGNWLFYLGANSLFIFIFHVYTNNVAYLIGEKYWLGFWPLTLSLSFILIYLFLWLYRKYFNFGIFKYV